MTWFLHENAVVFPKVPHKSVVIAPKVLHKNVVTALKVPHKNVVIPRKVPHKNVKYFGISLFFSIFAPKYHLYGKIHHAGPHSLEE